MSAPTFFPTDVAQIQADLKAAFEAAAGHTLYPAQPEQALLDVLAYRELLLRQQLQISAEMELAAYSVGEYLDALGNLVSEPRLAATPATVRLQAELAQPRDMDLVVAGGAVVQGAGIQFATQNALIIPAGQLQTSVDAACATTGTSGNGIPAGTPFSLSADARVALISVCVSGGGADAEEDEPYRARLGLAPCRFSMGGPAGGYRALVRRTSPAIVDVAVTSPSDGRVRVAPLCQDGLPNVVLLDTVAKAFAPEDARPLTDWVEVAAPTRVPYRVRMLVSLLRGSVTDIALDQVRQSLQAKADVLRMSLGGDLVPSQWEGLAQSVSGVYRAVCVAPEFRPLAEDEWPDCEGIELSLGEMADG